MLPGDRRIRVLVLDSSPIHTELLADALRRGDDLEVTCAESKADLIRTALNPAIDMLVISATIDEQLHLGLQLLREVRISRPDIRAVVLVDSSRPEVVVDSFRNGARGVFKRSESVGQLCKCIRAVDNGQIWANTEDLSIALQALASAPALQAVDAKGLSLLSKRETQIVQSLAEGLTNREIAKKLGLSQHTVKNYLFRIFDKLGVSSRVELLFMTLNQDSDPRGLFNGFLKKCADGIRYDTSALQDCQQAAEQGSPIAQLVLAQMYKGRRQSAADIVLAYKWYLIANAQVFHASRSLKAEMSMEQMLQAEEMAADWLKRTQEIPSPPTSALNRRAQITGIDASG